MIRRPSRSPWLLFAGLALASPLLPAPALAADRWTSIGPDLASVSALAVSPSGVAYAGTLVRGVFRSQDQGAHWSVPAETGYFPIKDLAADPGDPRRVYALGYQRGLSRSVNGGPWTFLGPGFPQSLADAFAIAPGDPRRLYVFVSETDLEVSRDGGATWEGRPSSLLGSANVLRVDPRNPDVLYVGNSGGVMKSVDGGRTWQAGSGLGETLGPVRALALDPRHPDVQYAGSVGQGIPTQGVWKSADAGETWERVLPIGAHDQVVALAVDPADPRRVYAAIDRLDSTPATGEVWRSTDAGASWSRALGDPRPVLSLAVDPADPRRVYAGFEIDGVLASGDRGATWRPARSGLRSLGVTGVAADPHHPGGLWVAAPENSLFGGVNAALFHSTDGGRSWVAAERGLTRFPPWQIALDPVRPERLFAFGPRVFYRSADGGASWQEVTALHGATVQVVAVDPSGRDRIYIAGFVEVPQEEGSTSIPLIRESLDGGESWIDLAPGFATGRPGGLAGAAGVLDGLAIQPDRPDTLFAGGTEGLFKSRDGGGRWLRLGARAGCQGASGIVVDPRATSTQYAFSFDYSHPVARSADRGAHWQCTSLGQHFLASLLADPHRSGTVYTWGLDGLFVTDDGGATWRPFNAGFPATFPRVLSLAADPHVPGRLYAGRSWDGLYTLTRSTP